MNKSEILALNNEELIAHALGLETTITLQSNSTRGITQKSIKDYKWTLEEIANRFNLDLDALVYMTESTHWFKDDK